MTEVEICVADAGGAAAASAGGAHRIELCTALELGGLTPGLGAIRRARENAPGLFVTVLVRARAGDFVYSADEVDLMVSEVHEIAAACRREGWSEVGVTTGALTPDGHVDRGATARLVEAADGLPVVFHKAFDQVPDMGRALEDLIDVGADALLTSGGGGPAVDHVDVLGDLAREGRITVCAAGGIRPANVARVAASGVRRIHLRAPGVRATRSRVPGAYDVGDQEITDAALVRQVMTSIRESDGR